MIKNIVFDMGGVLIDLNIKKVLNEHFSPEYHDRILSDIFYSKEWRMMDKGDLRPEEFIPQIVPSFPEGMQPLLSEMISDFYPYMPPYKETEELVCKLKEAGYNVYLLSNATPRFFDEYQNIPALRYFDGFFISALYHLLKPDAEIFNAFFKKFSLNPEECFFIDDMKENVEGARKCGMKGFVFDTRDYSGLKKELASLGVNF